MTKPLVIDTHTSARAVLGMSWRNPRFVRCGDREWRLGPRAVLVCNADDGRSYWTLIVQPDAYSGSTLYVEQEITRSRAAELLRSAGLDLGWYRRPTVLPRHALCSRS